MKSQGVRLLILFTTICLITAGNLHAESPVITSFSSNGQLEWSNAINTNARYRIQWASSLSGSWHNSFQSLANIEAHDETTFHATVPMFYRVTMTTNPPPAGMVLIDAGEFVMGNNYLNEIGEWWYMYETPVHTVFHSSFYMERYETSKALWNRVYSWAITNGYAFDNAGSATDLDHPVQTVNWYDCVKWCNARSQMQGLTPVYYTGTTKTLAFLYKTGQIDIQNDWVSWDADGYRLPTEAEWEKAARGGLQGHHYAWESYGGSYINAVNTNQANFYLSGDEFEGDWISGFPYTTPIGYYKGTQMPAGNDMANGYGLYDMGGNVWEWCWDWDDFYSASYQTNPKGPASGLYRIVRGGSWDASIEALRCTARNNEVPAGSTYIAPDTLGFRCVRSE